MFAGNTHSQVCEALIGTVLTEKGRTKMPDREKVASGLRHCLHYNGSCLDCPYDGPNCQNDVLDDALTLLKEQQKLIDDITQRRANNGVFD